jgi:heme/copper-type cytochrome/quinol oxidase subunit 3
MGGVQLFTLNRNDSFFDIMPNKKVVVTLQSVFYSKCLLTKFLLLLISSFSSWICLSAVICTSHGGSKSFSAWTIYFSIGFASFFIFSYRKLATKNFNNWNNKTSKDCLTPLILLPHSSVSLQHVGEAGHHSSPMSEPSVHQ